MPSVPDIVITVCSNAADETCPAYLLNKGRRQVVRAHWGVDDPAKATGTDEEVIASLEQVYKIHRNRI